MKPLAVCVGTIGKLPLAGFTLGDVHVIRGLHALGYDVHYLERQNDPDDCYDPRSNTMTSDPDYALDYLGALLPRHGVPVDSYSFIDRNNRCHGSGWPRLRESLDRADFVLSLGDSTWFDELERCRRRAFIDTDPLFTQVAMQTGSGRPASTAVALAHYDVLFTEGQRIGKPDCTIPLSGRSWIPTPPAISTGLWKISPAPQDAAVTTVMNWQSGAEVVFEGKTYGYKKREFEAFIGLPMRTQRKFVLAVGGPAPRERLDELGWHLVSPLEVTGTIEAYQQFIAESWADFGVAKHAYVVSRSGWFSDRSMCYLAAGRPVLHQDTGCGDWLPTGEGVLLFSTVEDVLEGLNEIARDYDRHARAARSIAEEYFEAATVIGRMLDRGGLR